MFPTCTKKTLYAIEVFFLEKIDFFFHMKIGKGVLKLSSGRGQFFFKWGGGFNFGMLFFRVGKKIKGRGVKNN